MKPIVGKLLRLLEPTSRGLRTLPAGTMLLVIGEVRAGSTFSVDYIVMHSGITERIPDYWHGWMMADEAG